MYEIRIHGLGGQGVVTMTEILAQAAFYEGWQVQAFPYFGPERTGAPVTGYIRLSHGPIKLKQQIYSPDLIIVLDDSLLVKVAVAAGAKTTTKLLINTGRDLTAVSAATKLPAAAITVCQPPADLGKAANMFVLGCALKNFQLASLKNCLRAIRLKLNDKDEAVIKNNLAAATNGYGKTTITIA
jgi:2-oxoacid:acceptor oxidoreductase gamma subunit (pyruvate/2-ketoisovalerate family)